MISMILTWLSGSVLDRLLVHAERRLESVVARDKINADIAVKEISAEIQARAEARKVLIAESGSFLSAGRLGRLAFVLPLALWWAAVCFDSVFHLNWSISEVPVLRDWGGAIVTSLFLVDGAKSVTRSIFLQRRQ
ncbi:hypothetical protein [Roseibium algae]|uniref:Holin (3TMs family) n=1 Tax=Roseibium algae TaxID=3123038 RepID=A0ABU8TJ72_9HYPH